MIILVSSNKFKPTCWLLFQTIRPDQPYCNIYDVDTSRTRSQRLKGTEPAIVDYVAVDVKNKKHLQKVNASVNLLEWGIIGIYFISIQQLFPL